MTQAGRRNRVDKLFRFAPRQRARHCGLLRLGSRRCHLVRGERQEVFHRAAAAPGAAAGGGGLRVRSRLGCRAVRRLLQLRLVLLDREVDQGFGTR